VRLPRLTSRAPTVCPHCLYIGHAHLCGCMGMLGKFLDDGDLPAARAQYLEIVQRANERIHGAREKS
jgi:hypothetical protein